MKREHRSASSTLLAIQNKPKFECGHKVFLSAIKCLEYQQ